MIFVLKIHAFSLKNYLEFFHGLPVRIFRTSDYPEAPVDDARATSPKKGDAKGPASTAKNPYVFMF